MSVLSGRFHHQTQECGAPPLPGFWESRGSSERKEPTSKARHIGSPEPNRPVATRQCGPPEAGAWDGESACQIQKLAEPWRQPPESSPLVDPGSPFLCSNSRLPPSSVPVPGPPIRCFSPSNFSIRQAAYVDSSCWDSLVHHEPDELGQHKMKSLWPHKVEWGGSIRPLRGRGGGGAGQSHLEVFSLSSSPPGLLLFCVHH